MVCASSPCFLSASLFGLTLLLPLSTTAQQTPQDLVDCPQSGRYTFSWSQDSGCDFSPRGGSSKGAPLTLDTTPSPGWLALQAPDLSKKEKDRRAILAMAGEYRASFEFLETVGYTPGFERSRPYQSWATEMILVLEDRPDFISLQHLMVMFTQAEDGTLAGPFVQKHWRQDWQYEKSDIMEFSGADTWTHHRLSAAQSAGTWAQAVYQVDDSPRYEAIGTWQHYPNFSTWRSSSTWRPLPRRESSVRHDYQILEGTNRHTIVPNGWVQEEENYKVSLNAKRQLAGATPYLSKELGVNRYERIKDFNFSAGDDYWQRTGRYWADVRAVWQEVFSVGPEVVVREEVKGTPLFAVLFEQAQLLTENGYNSAAARTTLRRLLQDYLN